MYIPTTTLTQGGSGDGYWDAVVRKATNQDVTSSTSLAERQLNFSFRSSRRRTTTSTLMPSTPRRRQPLTSRPTSRSRPGLSLLRWRGGSTSGLVPTTQVIQAGQVADLSTAIVWATGTTLTNVPVGRIIGSFRGDTNANFNFRWAQNVSDPARGDRARRFYSPPIGRSCEISTSHPLSAHAPPSADEVPQATPAQVRATPAARLASSAPCAGVPHAREILILT